MRLDEQIVPGPVTPGTETPPPPHAQSTGKWLREMRGHNIHRLDLHGNRLTRLPPSLGEVVPELEFIDVSCNHFGTVQDVLEGLQSLPRLRFLTITVVDEREATALKRALPQVRGVYVYGFV